MVVYVIILQCSTVLQRTILRYFDRGVGSVVAERPGQPWFYIYIYIYAYVYTHICSMVIIIILIMVIIVILNANTSR